MFCEISGPLSHAAYTERSTIVDLLIKILPPGRLRFRHGLRCVGLEGVWIMQARLPHTHCTDTDSHRDPGNSNPIRALARGPLSW